MMPVFNSTKQSELTKYVRKKTRRPVTRSGSCEFTVTDHCQGRILNSNAKLHNRVASLFVYEKPEDGVVPPFLVGEIAGSLTLEHDRQRLQEFAVAVLDWLESTESEKSNVVRNVPFGGSSIG
jgi:hypothetical protein